jgi:hypothetical protein
VLPVSRRCVVAAMRVCERARIARIPALGAGAAETVGGKQGGKRGRTFRARTPLAHAGGGDDDAGDARVMQCRGCRRCAGSRPCCRSAQLPLQAHESAGGRGGGDSGAAAEADAVLRCCAGDGDCGCARWGRWCGAILRQTKPVETTRHAGGPGRWQAGKRDY